VNDRGGHAQDFSISSVRDIALVVEQDRIQKRWYHAVVDHRQVICFLHIDINKLEDFFLDGSKSADSRGLCRNITWMLLVKDMKNDDALTSRGYRVRYQST